MKNNILIIEDDELLAGTFQRFLRGAGYGVDVAGDYAGGMALLTSDSYCAVFMDINLRGKQTGIDLLKEIRDINIDTPVVIITGSPEVATAAEAVRNTAFDYLCKPIEKAKLLEVAKAAVSHKIRHDEKTRYQKNLEAAFKSVKNTFDMLDTDRAMNAYDEAEAGQRADNSVNYMAELDLLSERERQVMILLGQGESNADIAAVLKISIRTVESHFTKIIDKLDLDGMKTLRRIAIRNSK